VVRVAGVGPGDRVVEVGAGLGSLTLALAEAGASVLAIELDPRLAAVAREVTAGYPVAVVEADALELSWPSLLDAASASTPCAPASDASWVLVANLPYYAATPVVLRVLEEAPSVGRLVVMVQREVGERLAARPGSRQFGAATVRLRYYATAELVGTVPRSVFLPVPRVDSVLVRIERRGEPGVSSSAAERDRLFELVRLGFAGRRKMLRRSLAGLVGPEHFERAGVDASVRAEELDVEQWGRLAEAVGQRGEMGDA